jgi:hypothetical protein
MTASPSSQAIYVANSLINIGQQLSSLEVTINNLSSQYTLLTLGTALAAMATCVVNADGTLGAADGTPTSGATHVIDTRVAAQAGLSRAISAADLASLNTLLQAVAQVLSGGAPPAQQGQSPQLLAKLVGG